LDLRRATESVLSAGGKLLEIKPHSLLEESRWASVRWIMRALLFEKYTSQSRMHTSFQRGGLFANKDAAQFDNDSH
jgi:hypothetical protein